MSRKKSRFLLSWIFFVYVFLYTPIVMLVAYSFNKGRTGHGWSGFTLDWYQKLFSNHVVMNAVALSLKLACLTATLSVLIGTIGGIVMVRFKTFRGRTFFNSIVTAPLVMPDVMVGLALLLFFVMLDKLIGWPGGRGFTTIAIGHITISIAYVLIVIRSRLIEFDSLLEQAAMDLGARPFKAFMRITLPHLIPSIGAGWLLAFTLSFDDIVLASFLSGPGTTTLPMYVFSSIRFGVTPEINALASLIVLIVAMGVFLAGVAMFNQKRKS